MYKNFEEDDMCLQNRPIKCGDTPPSTIKLCEKYDVQLTVVSSGFNMALCFHPPEPYPKDKMPVEYCHLTDSRERCEECEVISCCKKCDTPSIFMFCAKNLFHERNKAGFCVVAIIRDNKFIGYFLLECRPWFSFDDLAQEPSNHINKKMEFLITEKYLASSKPILSAHCIMYPARERGASLSGV